MGTNKLRAALLAGASAVALSVAVSAPAKAFNEVEWTWVAAINEAITKNVNINIDLTPTGMVMLENVQVSVGDMTADSTVDGVYNNQPTLDGGSGQQEVTFDLGTLNLTSDRDGNILTGFDHSATATYDFDESQAGFVSMSGVDPVELEFNTNNTTWTNQQSTELGTVTFLIDVEVEPSGSYDALTELPEVVSAATAVANNSSITSDVAIQMHEGQFAFGDFNGDAEGGDLLAAALAIDALTPTGNTHTDFLLGGIVLGQLGLLEQGDVTATSTVSNILNATVDSSATAVVNNKSITVETENAGDQLVIADVTQFGYMNASATSSVANVQINDYTNLGMLDRPIVNSVATAVGNNLSINVGAPAAP